MDIMIITLLINLIITAILFLVSTLFIKWSLSWWLRTKRADNIMNNFFTKLKYLEIKLPREVSKSPQAMEFVFNAIHQTLGHTGKIKFDQSKGILEGITKLRKDWYEKYTKGSMRMWSSLEIVSDEGKIKFYIVMPEKYTEILKSYTYSQYPGIEITAVEDYTNKFRYTTGGDTSLYVGRYILGDKDYLPIKTYVDFGLDKDPKEEFRMDPLTPLLEAMSSAGPGEHFWFQMLIKATAADHDYDPHGHGDGWREASKKRIDEILGITRDAKGKVTDQKKDAMKLTPKEKHELEIIQKNIEKAGFDCILRMFYVCDKSKFNLNKGVFTVVNAMKPFNKEGYNTFKFQTITTDTDYPFLDPTGMMTEGRRKFWWFLYTMRTGFYPEAEPLEFGLKDPFKKLFKGKSFSWAKEHVVEEWPGYLFPQDRHLSHALGFVLNAEELATIYHFPGNNFASPNASKVDSLKSAPPTNLPI
jgi:hypothetical protein